jgi:hypothetical protein
VTIIVAPWYLKGNIEAKGFNFLNWPPVSHPVLIFRNLLADPSFDQRVGSVDMIPRPVPEGYDLFSKQAQNFMGEYAPTGRIFNSLVRFEWWLWRQ